MAAACDGAGMRRILRGTDLRYTLTRLIQVLGPMTVSDLCAQLENLNFGVEGRPTKVVSDALRWEMGRDRVIRRGRGLYGEGWAPSGTAYRIVDRVESLKVEAESLRGGKTATRSFDRVSDNPFNPALWTPVGDLDAHFADLTDITYHRHVVDGVRSRRCGSRSTGPRCATRSGRTPSTSCTARSTTPGCRPTSAWCC